MAVVEVNIDRALKTEGWMEEDELIWLAGAASKHHRIVEVGSYLGRSTRALADNTDGVVYAIDNWEGPWEIDLPSEVRNSLLSKFRVNLLDHIDANKVIPIVSDHANSPRGLKPDMVFIDGDHSTDSVIRDVTFWCEELTAGGLLCGHDWDHPPVSDAVMTLLGDQDIKIINRIWSLHV